ncbi:MAG: acyltransferase domain-containing protein, partial [Acidobacteria bacterium]|nr:acyltransferase domain-containing protein [Acidobacteriota bacterium]
MNRTETHEFVGEPAVAIIGMTGRFPKAKSVDELWQNLLDGVEAISFFSDEELRASGINPATFNKPNYVRARAVLDDVELFDASFFGFNPKEAEIMDPQHRLFLECSWEALENAGYNSDLYEGRIGVYAGAGFSSYLLRNLASHGEEMLASVGFYHSKFSNDKDFLATRVCYKLNLRGPGVTVLTGSSTSLVAVHLACQSLLVGESDIMLAGGVAVSFPQKAGYLYAEGGIASNDGHCRAFDAKAHGTVGGGGVGVVVLKRLEDALADGDYVHAVIRGSAINNDGSAKVGYTAPSVAGQSKVIAEALSLSGVEPEQISYVEMHGSGTNLGDTVEMAALTQAFNSERRQFCAIGSLKTNIGHLSSASGVASLIKTALALKHRLIPPSLNFEEPNPKIDFVNSPFYVNSKLSVWESNGGPRRAGVSNWGIGGTNAHLILEEAPERLPAPSLKPYQLLTISAKSQAALEIATTNLLDHLKRHPELNLADIAYTLQIGRRQFDHRRMIVCRDVGDAVQGLETCDQKRVYSSAQEPVARPVIYMFPGLGDHYVGMGAQLYEYEPVFRKHVDYCCELLRDQLGLDLRAVIYPPGLESTDGHLTEPRFDLRKVFNPQARPADAASLRLNPTALAHPALFVIEYALAQMWIERGIQPQALIGHSLGEYVAACLAGVFTLEEALTLVARRAQMIQELPEGAMLAVPLGEHEVQALLGETLSLAAVNAPSLCVVAGPKDDALALEARLREEGIACRLMETSHAFHSKMMQPIFNSFVVLFENIRLQPPRIPYISNLSGRWITDEEATDPLYWAKHMCQPVRFADGVGELLKEERAVLLEVGPGMSLGSFVRQQTTGGEAVERIVISTLRNLYERQPDFAFMLNALGKLWLAGAQVDWGQLYAGERRLRVPLPTYPFERQRFWLEPKPQRDESRAPQGLLSKQADVSDWLYVPIWKETPLRAVTGDADEPEKRIRWLVFAEAGGLGSKIARQLEREGMNVVVVETGEQYARPADKLYRINPRAEADYETLIGELASCDMMPQAVAHLWGCTLPEDAPVGVEAFEESQYAGFYSLIFLARALSKKDFSGQVRIGVLSNRMHDVTVEQSVCPLKATALAACKVISQEYPGIVCQSIDTALPAVESAQEARLVERLSAEFAAAASDSVIAYSGNHRWTQTFESVPTGAAEGRKRLKEHGTYLLTGGLS